MNLPALIRKNSRISQTKTINNANWLQKNMSCHFFHAMTDQKDALQLLSREMGQLTQNRRLILLDQEKFLTIASVNQPGSIYDTLQRIGNRDISYSMFSHSNEPMPGMAEELEVLRFEFALKSNDEIYSAEQCQIPVSMVSGVRRELKCAFPDFDLSKLNRLLSILWCNNSKYLQMSPHSRIAWLVWLFEQGNRCGGLFVDIKDVQREGVKETRVLLAVGNPPRNNFLLQIVEVFNRLGIGIRRAYCQTITNGVHPYFLGAFFVSSRNDEDLSPESMLAAQLTRELATTQILSTESEAYIQFVTKNLISAEDAALTESFIAFCHTTLAHSQPERYGLDDVRSAFYDHPEMSQQLILLFKSRFDPDIPDREKRYQKCLYDTMESINSYNSGHRWLDDLRRTVYKTCQIFICNTLKTNFFLPLKQALAFRLDPAYLRQLGREVLSDLPQSSPFRISFFHTRFGFGYHIGFSDIARGGWRTVIARNADDLTTACNTLFREVYVLAHTQHLKNKDIYEGGSKMVLLLDSCDCQHPGGEEEECRLYKLQYSVANAFLDIFITENRHAKDTRIVDYYQDDEPIELGPDENMHDSMIEAIASLSKKRGYILGSGIMSSKHNGINHKEYGVTSTGVVTFAAISMAGILGKNIYEEPFSLKMTGGPNGDVAGNTIRIMLEECAQMKLTLLLDGTAALYDPNGISNEGLEQILLKHDLDHFDPAYLKPGATLIYRSGRKMEHLKELHRSVQCTETGLQESWLEIDEFYNLYNSLIFSVQTDLFIPAGGRPETIDSHNWHDFMTENNTPSARLIVEGANSFITPEARLKLQKNGCIIMRDASANKCGVISSSYEIIANLLLSETEFMLNKDEYVKDVLAILKKRAADEARLILSRHFESNGNMFCSEISDHISQEINANYAALFNFFETHTEFRMAPPFVGAIYRHLPALLVKNRRFCGRIKTLPGKYLSAILAAEIGSSLVYHDSKEADFEQMIRRHLARC